MSSEMTTAIVDTGTSLTYIPEVAFYLLDPYIGMMERDCSNFDELPDIIFEFDIDRELRTTAEYVMEPKDYAYTV